jgi:periplasmic divalent cation tolerance protein
LERVSTPPRIVQVQFAVDDAAAADRIAEALLDERLVACAQRTVPITSRYRWKGSLESADEWLVLLKTRAELAERVVARVVEDHPYDVPEVIVLPVIGGAPDYLDWIDEVTSDR